MKKPKTVLDAEAALAAKKAELSAAKDALALLVKETGAAYEAVTSAQTEADASLPQCSMVHVNRYTSREEGRAQYVILRRTPSGMLVVRRAGDAGAPQLRFKWAIWARVYRQVEKSYGSGTTELRDVPAEYMPKESALAE